jgi:peptide/nickel transport system permease protein
MIKYFSRRIMMSVLTLFVIMLVSYALLRLAPGDPTKSSFLGENQGARGLSAEKGAFARNTALEKKLHLD